MNNNAVEIDWDKEEYFNVFTLIKKQFFKLYFYSFNSW